MASLYECDRCGDTFKPDCCRRIDCSETHFSKLNLAERLQATRDIYDLCPKCAEALSIWLTNTSETLK